VVAEALRKTVHHGIFGEERFGMKSVYGVDCSLTRQIPMSVIKDGKPTYLATINWPPECDKLSATLLIQIVLSGLVTGLIYMLIALGVTLLFGIMRVVNFVHGELVMLSAFAIWYIGWIRDCRCGWRFRRRSWWHRAWRCCARSSCSSLCNMTS